MAVAVVAAVGEAAAVVVVVGKEEAAAVELVAAVDQAAAVGPARPGIHRAVAEQMPLRQRLHLRQHRPSNRAGNLA